MINMWKKIIKNNKRELTRDMERDIDLVVEKLMNQPSLIERVKKILEEEE